VTAQEPEQTVITASEVHEYFFCPYAWWYADRGVEPERMRQLQRGLDYHDTAAKTAAEPARWGRVLLVAAGLLAATAIVLHFLGVW
jgi:CRISPR/Cas system-associated exonuclease Cas4 (RecB family)